MLPLLLHARLRAAFAAAILVLIGVSAPAAATTIERIVSPSGIEAWLVRDASVPLIAMDFAFLGGANSDPEDKPGVGHMVSALLDEGAGDLDARAFQERLQEWAIQINFAAARDHFRGSLRTLKENRDRAFDLLRLALTAPRFEAEAIERIRGQTLASLRRETTSPNDIANRLWWNTAFEGHPYGRPTNGSLESIPRVNADDLRGYARRVFARDTLKIAIVGDIDAKSAGASIDRVFGSLPAKAELSPVPAAKPKRLGERIVSELDVPQSVIVFGGQGLARQDPDFFTAYVVNHILGGGSFSSRLYTEVRERRGLAYGVQTALHWMKRAALFTGGTATRSDRAGETLDIITREIGRMAESGPTAEELEKAKSYLKGSYALGFDTSGKIAQQLVQIQIDDLGIDYIDKRSALIDAVTPADAKRVAKRLLDGGLLFAVVGRSQGLALKGG